MYIYQQQYCDLGLWLINDIKLDKNGRRTAISWKKEILCMKNVWNKIRTNIHVIYKNLFLVSKNIQRMLLNVIYLQFAVNVTQFNSSFFKLCNYYYNFFLNFMARTDRRSPSGLVAQSRRTW